MPHTSELDFGTAHRRPRTILHVFSGDLWAGAESMIWNLLAELAGRSGLRFIALALNEGVLTSRLRELNIETHIISESRYSFAAILRRSASLFTGRQIDAIHSHRYKENLLSFLLGVLLRPRKLLTTIHGLPEPHVGTSSVMRPIDRLDHFVLRHAFAHVVAVSHQMKRELITNCGFRADKLTVIHNGIRPIEGRPTFPRGGDNHTQDSHVHIGTVGRLMPVKDYDLFLRIAAEILSHAPGARFSILGDGPLKGHLSRQVMALSLADRVSLLPFRQDTSSYYQSLDVYLNTSLHEGIPLSVLEAMAYGLPVIAPKVGGLPEIVSDGVTGYLVDGREPPTYTSRCLELMQEPRKRKAMGEASRCRVTTEYSSARMAEAYSTLYSEIA
jgi:L-malate glycosyltransferase